MACAFTETGTTPAGRTGRPPEKFASTVQFGELEVDLKQIADSLPGQNGSQLEIPETFSLPALLAFPSQASLLIQHDRDGRAEALQTFQMVMTRLLTTQPAGRVRFHDHRSGRAWPELRGLHASGRLGRCAGRRANLDQQRSDRTTPCQSHRSHGDGDSEISP